MLSSSLRDLSSFLRAERTVALTLLVSALGYFVDVFDLLLFGIVRVQSLRDLGIAEEDLLSAGVNLLNVQMAGLLLGGLTFGMIGDKFGRVTVLFASILLYSLGSIANGFVTTLTQYEILRFVTGFGLAGELGICITLASELLPKHLRGLATAFIAGVGVLGSAAAALVADLLDWRAAYVVGGLLGLALFALRMRMRESELFRKMEDEGEKVQRGNPLMFFTNLSRMKRYFTVILVGAPIWTAIGLFITFTPEFARAFGMANLPGVGFATLAASIGTAIGIVAMGGLSQQLQSRKKAIGAFLGILAAAIALFMTVRTESHLLYYILCGLIGLGIGYWGMMAQVGAEQFGTNLRATAATSIPNFIRALAIPATLAFKAWIPALGVAGSGLAVISLTFVVALASLALMRETFHTDLDYLEK